MNASANATTPGSLSYAQVALNRPFTDSFTYYIPESMGEELQVGSLVRVPLREGEADGVVIDMVDAPSFKGRIKPITRHLTPEYVIDAELIDLARWLAEYYFSSLGEALATVSMVGLNEVSPKTEITLGLADLQFWLTHPHKVGPDGQAATVGHRRVIETLLAAGNPSLPVADLKEAASVGDGVLKTMIDRGWLQRGERVIDRPDDYFPDGEPQSSHHIELTRDQQHAYDQINQPLHAGRYETFLLHGITGSGKTEIYLRVIEEALRIGRSAIVLVPEISLTPQVVSAFRGRLGQTVGVYHSRLTLGQKYDLWRKVKDRLVRIVIGARSALFAPLPELGVLIVDEEHETTYKQNETPRYHARDVAVMRALRLGGVAVLGSATPSVESLHNAREGKYHLLRLPERIGPHAPPVMTVIDMKRHVRDGLSAGADEAMLSPHLREAIERRIERGEQTVLLLNRRGFANQIICLACGHRFMCRQCDVPMTYHKTIDRLICHWCGSKQVVPQICPECQATGEIKKLGLGTQRIEETLGECFPTARVLRFDTDSMRRRGAFLDAWEKIKEGRVEIILGTQMIAKGLHLERVTLVGVISADFALFLPDFRSAERTYALLTQVAGRAGRGQVPGEVILQSFMPQHYAIDSAARLAEKQFYERELHNRRMLQFPPFARLGAIILSGEKEDMVREQAGRLAGMLKTLAYRPNFKQIRILGPTPAPLVRLENQYRWRILARGKPPQLLHTLLRQGLAEFTHHHRRSQVSLTIDIDPMDLL